MANLSLEADLSKISAVHEFVERRGRDLSLDDPVVCDLKLAVDEAYANIVRHAYCGQEGMVQLTIEAVTGGVQVTVQDWGAPFEPESISCPDVMAPLDQRPLGGLGLYLIRQIMDQVDFRFDGAGGNTLTMVKRIATQEASSLGLVTSTS
jgi:serine/threonine-protein kinase RsbW